MKKRDYTKKQMAAIILLSIGMLAAAAILNQFFPSESKQTSTETVVTATPTATPTVTPEPTVTPDPTEEIASFLQGPKSWKERRNWSGEWGESYYDGGSFGGFGCGLCCMANVYCSLTDYRCSPVDMYRYAKKKTEYGGGGAIDWGYMKGALESAGMLCDVWRKPSKYTTFQDRIKSAKAAIVVVSSNDSQCYWKDTPGHYVTLFLYDEKKDQVFLADSGDPEHNRQWVKLSKIYKSLKTSNPWQMLLITDYNEKKDTWKHKNMSGKCVLPEPWSK